MFDYLLFAVLLLWYKDPTYLGKFINNLSWLFGILYARTKTSSIYYKIQDFLLNIPTSPKNTKLNNIYIIKDSQLQLVDIKDINNFNSNKYYVRVVIRNKDKNLKYNEKVLVFADKNTLINNYNNLSETIEKSLENFSKIMEATKGGIDILSILNKYINGNDNFSNITGYKIKYNDIYDFDSNRFLLESNDKLDIIDMNLNEFHLTSEDLIGFNNS